MTKEIKTSSGFICNIEQNVFNDYEVLDMLLEVEEGNPLQFARLMKRLLGKEQYSKAKDFIRNEQGIAETEKMYQLLSEIFLALGEEGKKS